MYRTCFRIGHRNFSSNNRAFVDFFNDLPKVGGNVSLFGTRQVVKNGEDTTALKLNKPNRFFEKYSKKNKTSNDNAKKASKPSQSSGTSHNQNKSTSSAKEEIDRINQYKKLRKQLNEKEKQATYTKSKMPVTKKVDKKVQNSNSQKAVKISIPSFISVSNLASTMNVPLNDVFKKLEELGFDDIRHNYILDKENASLIADEFNFEISISENNRDDLFPEPVKENLLKTRPPVVTIMGHVDHGKTTILDYLRKSSIVNQEFGGITQHIGAFSVIAPISKKKITFLDTPGHAAFLKMRERGAIITDIVILVVAADDSVMPQTIEAIKHAKKSGVPIIVALNKCDKPGINTDKVLADISGHGIDIEDYGGETQTVKVSGKTGLNMDKLEEAVITLSEMMEYKAEYQGVMSEGWVIESQIVKGMGSIATILVRRGTVKVGDFLVAGNTYCKVRGMKDEHGKSIKVAGPSTPAQIWGWKDSPEAGDQVLQAPNEQTAKKVTENRITRQKEIQSSRDIESINQKRQEEIQELKKIEKMNELKLAGLDVNLMKDEKVEDSCTQVKYIIKSDVFGSAEAIKESIDCLGNDEVKSVVVSHEAGLPSESDIDLAKTLNASILCFNVKIPKQIIAKADRENVTIKEHNIIYRLIEDVTEELTSHLKPNIETKILGEADIKDVFTITSKSKSKFKIAGVKVISGLVKRSSKIKVIRNNEIVFTGLLSSLKHVKDDISEAKRGTECGLSFENWDKFQAGDKIQIYEEISHPRYL